MLSGFGNAEVCYHSAEREDITSHNSTVEHLQRFSPTQIRVPTPPCKTESNDERHQNDESKKIDTSHVCRLRLILLIWGDRNRHAIPHVSTRQYAFSLRK